MPVNPWLAKKVAQLNSPPYISTLVEVDDPAQVNALKKQLGSVSGISVGRQAFNMVEVNMPHQLVGQVGKIPGVTVHYNAPKTIRNFNILGKGMAPKITALDDLRAVVSENIGPLFALDPLLGKYSISSIEIPYTPEQMFGRFGMTLPNRLRTLPPVITGILPKPLRQTLAGFAPKNDRVIITSTGETRKWVGVPEVNKMRNTKVCVLDTGIGFPDPFLLHPTKGNIYMDMTIEHPNPLDGLGHGHWCITACAGDTWETDYGTCRGVCDPENGTLGSIKCLSTVGFGTSFSVIKAIENAYKWGAKVVSMSLGGELQGSVDDDPECKIIAKLKDEVIFVVAAGNSGPEPWTIGSPGASPHCITVGAWSTIYNGLAIFSSRGPSGIWYKDNVGQWEADLRKYGSNMLKPDCVAPGGGPVVDGDIPDMIYSGVRGWTDGMNDLIPGNGFDAMRGTSMATPIAAGIIALAVDRGYVKNAQEVKAAIAKNAGDKTPEYGYGMIHWKSLSYGMG